MAWYPLESADATFFERAPIVHRYPVEFDVPPERVWQQISSDESLGAWGLGVRLRWLSARPFDVGTTREVVLPARVLTLRERFFRWDEGEGYSFFVESANRPWFVRFAEDYVIEKTARGSRFTWTIAIEGRPLMARILKLTDPFNKIAFGLTPRAGKRYFRAHP
jgi:uncharacterized protein YndB with AHSA1/START domain